MVRVGNRPRPRQLYSIPPRVVDEEGVAFVADNHVEVAQVIWVRVLLADGELAGIKMSLDRS